MKLFSLRFASSKSPLPGHYFSDKPSAKRKRDELTKSTGIEHVVTYGPEHRKYAQKK